MELSPWQALQGAGDVKEIPVDYCPAGNGYWIQSAKGKETRGGDYLFYFYLTGTGPYSNLKFGEQGGAHWVGDPNIPNPAVKPRKPFRVGLPLGEPPQGFTVTAPNKKPRKKKGKKESRSPVSDTIDVLLQEIPTPDYLLEWGEFDIDFVEGKPRIGCYFYWFPDPDATIVDKVKNGELRELDTE